MDSSFNPRRAGYSLLRAHQLPPKGTGGNTEYADARTAFDELPKDLKQELLDKDYVVCHSLYHSRKLASPQALTDINPEDHFMSRHKLIQKHEPSGRTNLYIASHAHHVEGVSPEDSKRIIDAVYKHACQPKYVVSIEWKNNNDLILWYARSHKLKGFRTDRLCIGTTHASCIVLLAAVSKGNMCGI